MKTLKITFLILIVFSTFVHAIVFLDYADTRSNKGQHEKILALMNDENPSLILNNGDLADGYRDDFISVLQAESNVKDLLDKNLYLVSQGSSSHDPESWLKGLRPTVLRDNSTEYSVTLDNCFFVTQGNSSRASDFLRDQLGSDEAKAAQYRFVWVHEPVYSSGRYQYSGNSLKDICDEYDVSMVFGGHSHHYERTKVIYDDNAIESGDDLSSTKGTVYVVSGGGGAGLYGMSGEKWWTNTREEIYHYVKIDAGDEDLTVSTINDDGEVIDAFTWARNTISTSTEEPFVLPDKMRQEAPFVTINQDRTIHVEFIFSARHQVNLLSIGGRVLESHRGDGISSSYRMSDQHAPGMYLLSIETKSGTYQSKMILW